VKVPIGAQNAKATTAAVSRAQTYSSSQVRNQCGSRASREILALFRDCGDDQPFGVPLYRQQNEPILHRFGEYQMHGGMAYFEGVQAFIDSQSSRIN
jgi:hypothetical protein